MKTAFEPFVWTKIVSFAQKLHAIFSGEYWLRAYLFVNLLAFSATKVKIYFQ